MPSSPAKILLCMVVTLILKNTTKGINGEQVVEEESVDLTLRWLLNLNQEHDGSALETSMHGTLS